MGLRVVEGRACICGWPTDTLTIDDDYNDHDNNDVHSTSCRHDRNNHPYYYNAATRTHTLLIFIPGNPGIIHWYTQFLVRIVTQLGKGYAVRGISYAGHGVDDDVVGSDDHNQTIFHDGEGCDGKERNESINVHGQKDMRIAWTMEGQSEYICCYHSCICI
jgi:hypothetical protein